MTQWVLDSLVRVSTFMSSGDRVDAAMIVDSAKFSVHWRGAPLPRYGTRLLRTLQR